MSLRSSDKARLRDWYDTSGTWVIKITSLYELVDRIAEKTIERRLAPVREYIAQLDRAAEDNAARVYGADLVMASDVARVVAMSLRNALGDGCSDTTIPSDCRILPATVDLLTRRPDLHHIGAVGTVLWGWVSA